MRSVFVLVVAALGLTAAPVLCGEKGLDVSHAWIAAGPPGARMLAGYLLLENHGSTERVLVHAESPAFDSIQFHRSEVVDGVWRMRRQARLELPPGGVVQLEPGGLHLMLLGPVRELRPGDRVDISLIDSEGNPFTFAAELRPRR